MVSESLGIQVAIKSLEFMNVFELLEKFENNMNKFWA